MRKRFGLVVMLSVIGLVCCLGSAKAGVECYRSDECTGEVLCMNVECVSSVDPLAKCQTETQCENNEICHDGFCKNGGVACSNPAGYCFEDNTWGECSCAYGDYMDWEVSPGYSMTGPELYEICVQELVQLCGEDIPNPDDYCEDEQQEQECVDIYTKLFQMEAFCYGVEPNDVTVWDISDCCESLNSDYAEYYRSFFDCIMALEDDDCEGFEECIPDDDYDTDYYDDYDTETGYYDDYDTDSDSSDDSDSDTTADQDSPPEDGADSEGSTEAGGCSVTNAGSSDGYSLMATISALLI